MCIYVSPSISLSPATFYVSLPFLLLNPSYVSPNSLIKNSQRIIKICCCSVLGDCIVLLIFISVLGVFEQVSCFIFFQSSKPFYFLDG